MESGHVSKVGKPTIAFIAVASLVSLPAIACLEDGTVAGQARTSGASSYDCGKGGGKPSRNSRGEADLSFSSQSKTKLFVSVNAPRHVMSGGSDSIKRDPSTTTSLGSNRNDHTDRGEINFAQKKAKEKEGGSVGDIETVKAPPSPPPRSLVLPLVAPAIARAAAAISTVLAIQTTLPEYELETALESYLETLHIEQERGPARDPTHSHSISIAELTEESYRDESRSISELHNKKKRIVSFGCVDIARLELIGAEEKGESGANEGEDGKRHSGKGQDRLHSDDDENSAVIAEDAASTRKSPLYVWAGHVVEMHVIASQVIRKRLEEGAGLEPPHVAGAGAGAGLDSGVADGDNGAAPPHANPPSDTASSLAHVHDDSRGATVGSGKSSPSIVTVRSCNVGFASSDDASEVLSQVATAQSRIHVVGGIDNDNKEKDNEIHKNDRVTSGGEERRSTKMNKRDEALPQLAQQEKEQKRDHKDQSPSSSNHRSDNSYLDQSEHHKAQTRRPQGGSSLLVSGKNRVVGASVMGAGSNFGLPDSIFGASVVCQREPANAAIDRSVNFNDFAGKGRWMTAEDSDDDDDNDNDNKNSHGHLDTSHKAGKNMCGAPIEEAKSMYSGLGSEGHIRARKRQEENKPKGLALRPFQSSEPAEKQSEHVNSGKRLERTGVEWSLTNTATPRYVSAMHPILFGIVGGLLLGCALGLF